MMEHEMDFPVKGANGTQLPKLNRNHLLVVDVFLIRN